MAVITALQKYVREHVLVTWLTETFGGRDTGVWSIEVRKSHPLIPIVHFLKL